MEKVFENTVLDDLFTIRRDGFEYLISKTCENSEKLEKVDKVYQILEKLVKDKIVDEKCQEEVLKKLDEFHDAILEEMELWVEHYYKFGLTDGMLLKEEIEEKNRNVKKIGKSADILDF